jgi:transposase
MVLLAADGIPNAQIGRTVGVSRPTVIGWRDRYSAGGIAALEDEPRSALPADRQGTNEGHRDVYNE